MRIFYFYTILMLSLWAAQAQCPQYQDNLVEFISSSHYKDLNTIELEDNSHDFVIVGTKFTESFTQETLFLVRINGSNGSIVWKKEFDQTHASRGFDAVRYDENGQEYIAVTGYTNNGNLNEAYIAVVDATNGTIVRENAFEIEPGFHSQGLHIIYTEKNYNGAPEPGFVVAGFYNFIYTVNVDDNGSGFLMRTDINLAPLWTRSSESSTTGLVDYDMMNRVTETSVGFFVTGSVNEPSGTRQSILLSKFDGDGNTLWTNSYVRGNFRDVGVDAYFESATGYIYVLVYYSDTHYFGLTTIDSSTGSILLNHSWSYVNGSELNRTGFKISKNTDPSFPNDLVIFGYERDAIIQDPTGPTVSANTVPFTVSVNKTTGRISYAKSYPVPYKDNPDYQDYFRFWEGQSPLIFHPDMGFVSQGGSCSFMVANRSYGPNRSAIEMIALTPSLQNTCDTTSFTATENLINLQLVPTTINNKTIVAQAISYSSQNIALEKTNCEQGTVLSVTTPHNKRPQLFPNPTNSVLNVNTTIKLGYRIFDVSGKQIMQDDSVPDRGINLTSLQNGVYFIKFISEDNKTETFKFIKQ
ncbi:T9SS type A sorting domain-containing protein [Marinirhabdus gelatinilytica]|uniref:Putative secreted protein (Por secretion system target) n=1 Tax=Marinirhabdus gelatinilytica TaxID=1703343 RepID=A0A370QJQ4_9FLAO|nr:T9SS type A sorting domain-containing protein [Marinirhabdus gelatinilytica]RDK88582.1 putative secreted protein (Por secretion system target) [Marinirhabdus gelatinilytica]